MRQFILALLVGAAFAGSFYDTPTGYSQWDDYQPIERQVYQREIKDTTFRAGREYKYFYDGQVMNGIPKASKQHSSSRFQAVVILQVPSANQMILKVEHIRLGKLNKKVSNPRMAYPFQFFEPVEVSEQLKAQLHKPVKFSYVDGLIKNIHMENDDSSFSKNVKRGILNLLQINLKEHNSLDSSDAQRTNEPTVTGDSKFFRVMETMLEGECETQYSIVSLPEHYQQYFSSSSEESGESSEVSSHLNISKSINFNRCNRRPEVKYNFRYVTPCKSCDPKYQESSKYLKPSTVIKYNIAGNRENFMIENVRSESQYTIEFMSEEGSYINVYTNQTLNLYKSGPISQQISLQNPVQSQSELLYSQHWDILNEKYMMNPEESQQYPHKPQNLVEKIVELANKLVTLSSTEEGLPKTAPNKFALLVSALRKANMQDLQKIHEKLVSNPEGELNSHQKKFLRDIVPTAVALAGTDPAIKHIVEIIRENKVPNNQKASLLRQLHNTRIVSNNIINHVKALAEASSTKEVPQVHRAAYLALGTLMRAACGNNQDKLAIDSKFSTHTRCSETHKKEFVQMLINKMKSSSNWENKVLYMKALSNAALDVSIQELEKIIQNRDQYYPSYVRYEAILAMRHLTNIMPRKVQKVLMPVFMQPREPTSLREVAVFVIVNSQPERSLLEMIARQINREPKRQVAAFTYNFMREMANSTNPCHKQLSADLKLALRFAHEIPQTLYDSKFYYGSFQQQLKKLGLDLSLFDVMNNNSLIPKVFGGSVHTNLLGFYNQDLFTAAINSEGLESLIPRFWNNEGYNSFSEVFRSRHPRSARPHRESLRQIFEKLGIQARQSNTEPKLYGYTRYEGQETGYLPISEQLIEQAIEDETLSWNSFINALQSGESKHFSWHYATMMEDAQYKIPTSVGLPLIVKHKSPLMVKIDGSVKAHLKSGKKIDLLANLKPSLVFKRETTVEVWSPDLPTGARVRGLIQANVPIKAEGILDLNKYELKINYKSPSTRVQVLHAETQPITFTRPRQSHRIVYKQADEKIVFSEEINRVQKINRQVSSLGMGFHLNGRYTPPQPQQPSWLPMCPLSGPNKLFVFATPSQDNTKQVEMIFNLDGSYRTNSPLKSSLLKSNYESIESESQSSEEQETENFNSNIHRFGKIHAQIKTKGGSNPTTYTLNADSKLSSNSRFGKISAKFERSPKPFQMCLDTEVMYPQPPQSRKSVLNKKVIEHAQIRWGQTCEANNFIKISASAERTRQQLQYERENLESYQECKNSREESPVACYEYLKTASFMNKYTVNVNYNNVPVQVQNATNKIMRALKSYYYMNTDVANVHVRNPVNKIHAEIRFEPRDMGRVNITLKSPRENVTMQDIWTPIRLPRHNVKRSIYSSLVDEYFTGYQSYEPNHNTYQTRPVCKVRPNYIRTFDGRRYRNQMSKCFSVVAQDCSEQNRFAVLVKNEDTESENKVVKILTHSQKLVLKKQGSNFVVRKNGEESNLNEYSAELDLPEEPSSMCQRQGSNMIRCSLPNEGIKIYYDGENVDVKVSPFYVSKQCGLCGNLNFEPNDEFRLPNDEFVNDVREFQNNYFLKDQECESSLPEVQSICDSDSCEYEPEYSHSSSEESSYEIPSEFHNKQSMEPRLLNRVVQKSGKICFSKQPLPHCSMHAHPSQAEDQEVEYTCLSHNNLEAADWAQNAHQVPIDEVKNLPTTFTKTELVPTKCYNY